MCTVSIKTRGEASSLVKFEQKFEAFYMTTGDRGSTVVKMLFYKSEGSWFDPSWYQWIFH